MQLPISDPYTICPHCEEKGGLSFKIIPESTLHYHLNGVDCVDYLPATRDYSCWNCDGAFLLLEEEILDGEEE